LKYKKQKVMGIMYHSIFEKSPFASTTTSMTTTTFARQLSAVPGVVAALFVHDVPVVPAATVDPAVSVGLQSLESPKASLPLLKSLILLAPLLLCLVQCS
jgi:hypothetical protein